MVTEMVGLVRGIGPPRGNSIRSIFLTARFIWGKGLLLPFWAVVVDGDLLTPVIPEPFLGFRSSGYRFRFGQEASLPIQGEHVYHAAVRSFKIVILAGTYLVSVAHSIY